MPNTHYALGCCTVAAMSFAFQAYLGRNDYLEFVAEHWVTVPGGFWIGLAAMAMSIVASGVLERRERRTNLWLTERIRDLSLKVYGTRGWGEDNDKPEWSWSTRWKNAGLLTVSYGCARWEYSVHVGVMSSECSYGYACDWCDGPLHEFGFGPLFLICWR